MNAIEHMAMEEAVARVRTEFETNGFHVTIRPGAQDIPPFLEGYLPDAIAKRGEEKVIIGIKSAFATDQENEKVAYMAREVPKHPGWRFDLYLARPRQETLDAPFEPNKAELLAEWRNAKRLAESSDPKAALAYAWGLLEATARRLVLNERRGEAKRYRPASVVETLVSEGFINDKSGEALSMLASLRNLIVHGFTKADVSEKQIAFLLATIGELIEEIPADVE